MVDGNWLIEISRHHSEWVKIARSFGVNDPEDIIQEMYIRLFESNKGDKAFQDGKVNHPYIFFVIRNAIYNINSKKSTIKTVDLDSIKELSVETINSQKIEAIEIIDNLVKQSISNLPLYDRLVFDAKVKSGKSFRDLEKVTGVTTRSLFYAFKKCRQAIINEIGEDYEDFRNQDFELILK